MSETTCRTCFGTGRVKVSWSPVVGSTYKIKVHYEPCPDCEIGAMHEAKRAHAAPALSGVPDFAAEKDGESSEEIAVRPVPR